MLIYQNAEGYMVRERLGTPELDKWSSFIQTSG